MRPVATPLETPPDREHETLAPESCSSRLDADKIAFEFSKDARDEVRSFLQSEHARCAPEELVVAPKLLPRLDRDVMRLREQIDGPTKLAITSAIPGIPLDRQLHLNWIVSKLLGDPVVQKRSGERLVRVFDHRAGFMSEGRRYHQSNEGGSIHTDNVNVPDPWDWVVLSCVIPAREGGQSIFVHAVDACRALLDRHRESAETLGEPFYFERRGIDATDSIYESPILTFGDDDEPEFRYLRDYIESAHRRVNRRQPFDDRQQRALDDFDAVLADERLRYRQRLECGEIVVASDRHVLHGRTTFEDWPDAVGIDRWELLPEPERKTTRLRRAMGRTWIKRPLVEWEEHAERDGRT